MSFRSVAVRREVCMQTGTKTTCAFKQQVNQVSRSAVGGQVWNLKTSVHAYSHATGRRERGCEALLSARVTARQGHKMTEALIGQ